MFLALGGGGFVKMMSLGEVAFYPKDRILADFLHAQNYVGVENLLPNKQGKINSSSVPKSGNSIHYKQGDCLIGNIRPYLKKIWLADNDGGTNGDVLLIRTKNEFVDKIQNKFLYYVLASDSFFAYHDSNARGAKMPRGDKSAVLKFQIPIPPLKVQNEVVEILDKFDALVNDISQGLPAEITARKKQYEHYREKLLSFKEKA